MDRCCSSPSLALCQHQIINFYFSLRCWFYQVNLLKQKDLKLVRCPLFLSLNFLVQQVVERNQSPADWQFWQLLFSGCQCVICYSPSQLKTEQRHMHCQSHSSDLAPGPQIPPLALFYSFPISCHWSAFKFWAMSNYEAPLPQAHLLCVLLQHVYSVVFSLAN